MTVYDVHYRRTSFTRPQLSQGLEERCRPGGDVRPQPVLDAEVAKGDGTDAEGC
jgi:hypothetical protein